MAMYVVSLSDNKLGCMKSVCTGTTLSGTPMGAPSFAPTFTSTRGRGTLERMPKSFFSGTGGESGGDPPRMPKSFFGTANEGGAPATLSSCECQSHASTLAVRVGTGVIWHGYQSPPSTLGVGRVSDS
jgi:hypothetical protein